jgi:hypothetical protein
MSTMPVGASAQASMKGAILDLAATSVHRSPSVAFGSTSTSVGASSNRSGAKVCRQLTYTRAAGEN